jgi:hypothetical protein
MKTTVDLPEDLVAQARDIATRERTTLRSLIEEGLRWAVARRRKPVERFTLRDAGVAGRGVQPGLDEGDWGELRDVIYRGRGS